MKRVLRMRTGCRAFREPVFERLSTFYTLVNSNRQRLPLKVVPPKPDYPVDEIE